MKRAKGNAALTIVQETDEKIAEQDLNGLKKYLCAKSRGKWEACLECPKRCSAGDRLISLMDEETRPKEVELPNPKKLEALKKAEDARVAKARERCRKAVSSGNPIGYLMETYGVTYKVAKERIRKYTFKYPDLCESIRKEDPEKAKRKKAEIILALKKTLEQKDPIGYVAATYDCNREKAWGKIVSWITAAREEADSLNGDNLPGALKKRLQKYQSTAEVETVNEEQDEVSIAEFLRETQPGVDQEEQAVSDQADENLTPESEMLRRKCEELKAERARLEAEIRDYQTKIDDAKRRMSWIDAKQVALSDVLSLFR